MAQEEIKVKKQLRILIQKLDAKEIEKYTRKTGSKNKTNKRSRTNLQIKQEFSGVGSLNFAINGFIQTKCEGVNKYSLRSKNGARNPEEEEKEADQSVTEDTTLIDLDPFSNSVRQQPVVYINPNLNKIKIEDDYVPVPEIKTEPPDSSLKLDSDPDPDLNSDETIKFFINPNIFEDASVKKEEDSQSESAVKSPLVTFDKETQTTPLPETQQKQPSTKTDETKEPEKKVKAAEVEKILDKALKKKRGIQLTFLQLKCLIKSIEKKNKKISRMKKQVEKDEDPVHLISKSPVNAVQVCSVLSHLESEQKFQVEKDRLEKQNRELEDRIAMYSKKVVALFREKSEIQSSLQGKIDEVTSKVGAQQTEIEQLKRSEIQSTLQEKINGLNAQLNWQQTLIGQFNQNEVQVTMQNEIGRLTISQAQKSDQILILNDKLNIQQSEIRQLHAKIVMDADKQEQLQRKIEEQQNLIEEMGQPKFKMADLSIHILRQILDSLDISSLKNSRLVCRGWNYEGAKILNQKTFLTGRDSPVPEFSKSFLNSARNLCATDDLSSVRLLEKCPKLRLSIRRLKFEGEKRKSTKIGGLWNSQTLYKNLQLLPNLERLQTNVLNFNPAQEWLQEKVETFNRIYSKLELFLMALENLKELKLECILGQGLAPHFFRHYQRLECIQEIHVAGMSVLREFLRVNVSWAITKLTLDVNVHSNTEIIRDFLRRISKSLQHYRINLTREFMTTASAQTSLFFLPWADDWIIPQFLNKLETLEVGSNSLLESSSPVPGGEPTSAPPIPPPPEFYIRLDEYLTKILLACLLLPNLRNLAIGCIPREFEGICRKWNDSPQAKGRRIQSRSLKQIKLLFVFPPTLPFPDIPTFIWPNLKLVKFSRRTVNGFIVEEQRHIEHL